MLPPSLAGPVVNERNALCLAPVWAAVRVLSFTAASCPLLVYRRVDDTSRVRWDGPPAPLLQRPSPTVTPSGFIATTVSHLALTGNAFLGLFRNADGVVEQIVPLEPESIVVNVIGGLVFYEWSPPDGGELRTLTTEDLCHVRMLSTDGIIGRSPVAACRESLALGLSLQQHASATFANGAAIRGVLSVKTSGPHADDVVENLRLGFAARHSGPSNAGKTAIVREADVSFSAVAQTLADAEFIASREFTWREVAAIMGVPAWAIEGETGSSLTYSTTLLQRQALLDRVHPYLVQIEESLTIALTAAPIYCEHSREAWLESDPTTLADVLGKQIAAGLLTQNEARARLNLPAIAGGDVLAPIGAATAPQEVPA